ncbi:hypothetical protein HRbin02_01881 [Candidatus Calditenuaceae archaeon HR02]|nr:hypothetical protein HRbin02_01881 [Candidatus Calditenuaceae archaeon HR02]
MDEIGERKDWWKICEMLRIAIGRRMKRKGKPNPSPFSSSLLLAYHSI